MILACRRLKSTKAVGEGERDSGAGVLSRLDPKNFSWMLFLRPGTLLGGVDLPKDETDASSAASALARGVK